MSCKVSKKLLKCTASGVSDINKQNNGWRARMVWIQNEPVPVNDWWNRPRPQKQQGLQGYKPQQPRKKVEDNVHDLQRYIELGAAILEQRRAR
jgi:hypothetical protein